MAESGENDQPRFALFGGVTATVRGASVDLGGPKQRAVLAMLALDAGRVVSVDRLVEGLWNDHAPEQAGTSLRSYTSNLRRILNVGIENRRPGYVLLVDPSAVDVHRFEQLVAKGQAELRAGDPATAAVSLRDALALWVGPPFGDVADDLDIREIVARLFELRTQAIEALAESRLELGENTELVPDLAAAVREQPYRERLQQLHALALYRSGRQVEALRALDGARRTLVDDVGVEPGAELRALVEAILAHDRALDWRPQRAANAPPEPSAIAMPASGDALIGRASELEALLSSLHAAAAGSGRAVVVSGEPGIGKTRIVEELAARARALGTVVAWARCPESAASAAYWPWLQVAEQLADAQLAPSLVTALHPERAGTGDAGVDQLHLRVAVVNALATATRPVLIVIEDLHWADAASLGLTEFVAADLSKLSVLLAVTTRPPGSDTPLSLLSCLGELARSPRSSRIALDGLSPADVGVWLAAHDGDDTSDATTAAFVYDRTGGNPFFVRELVALLATHGRLRDAVAGWSGAIPAAVQDVVRRRASGLPPATQKVLSSAAVVGRRFDVDVLAGVLGVDVDEVLDELEPAVDADLVVLDASRPGRFAFSHALVAETLAAELNAVRRARVHAATARALSTLRAADPDAVVEELAYHAYAGATAGTAELAVTAGRRATQLATEALAFADAAAHLEHAIAAHELAEPGDRAARYDMFHRLGVLRAWAGDVQGARRSLADAGALAESLGDANAMVRSLAFINVDDFWSTNDWQQHDPRTIALLKRALALLAPDDDRRRAAVMSALALQLYAADLGTSTQLAEDAVTLARRFGDPDLVVRTLFQSWWSLWRPSTNALRSELAAEMLDMLDNYADVIPPRTHALIPLAVFSCAIERGDGAEADISLARTEAALDAVPSPELRGQFLWSKASLLMARGRFDEILPLADEMWEAFWQSRRFVADVCRVALVTQAHAWLGDIEASLSAYEPLAGTLFEAPAAWFRANTLAEVGRIDEATKCLSSFDATQMADDWFRPVVLTAGLHAAVTVGDRDLSARVASMLRPVSGLWAVNGSGGRVEGPMGLAVARADHLLGDEASAELHLAEAIAAIDRLDAAPWRARALAVRAELERPS